jgi:flagellin
VQPGGSSSAVAEISAKDRALLNSEFPSLRDVIDRVAAATTFDGVSLLWGDGSSPGSPKVIDFGSSDTAGEVITASINAADSASFSSDLLTVDLESQAGGSAAAPAVTSAQASVDGIRAAVRGARAQLNSVGAAAGETSAIVECVQEMKISPETVIELSRVVAS